MGEPRRLGRRHGPHHAPSRPGENRVLGLQLGRILQGPAGGHHPQGRGRSERLSHLMEIALQHGTDRRFDRRSGQTRHQPGLAAHLMRQHHSRKAQLLEPGSQLPLMGRLAVGMHQGHGTAAVAIGKGLTQLPLQQRIPPKWLQLTAICP